MPASLAPILYAAHRSALSDPTSVPAWGNAPTEEREAWEVVARKATDAAADRLEGSLNDRDFYEAMQSYRHAGFDQARVIAAFEDVQKLVVAIARGLP